MVKPEIVCEHLVRRNGVWYFRRRIPTDILPLFAPVREIRKSLGRRLCEREAAVIARRLSVDWDTKFAAARHEVAPHASGSLDPSQIIRYAEAWVHWRLEEDDSVRRLGYTVEQLQEAQYAAQADLQQSRREFSLGSVASIQKQLVDFSIRTGLPLPTSEAEVHELSFALLRAEVRAMTAIVARDTGDAVDTPPSPSFTIGTEVPPSGRTLRQVFEKWSSAEVRPAKTVADAERALATFERLPEHASINLLTREQGSTFKGHLLRKAKEDGNKNRTAKKTLDWVKTLLNFAERELQWIQRSPWSGINIDKSKATTREPWEPEDLVLLFGTALFTSYAIPKRSKACLDAAYWVPLIAAFTGARVSEIAQLRVDDITRLSAIHCFAFRDDGDGQSLKTQAARREVPIHSELLRLGILDYTSAIREAKSAHLFPAIPRNEHANGAGGYVSDWFGDYKTALGFGPSKVFHSFRHTVRTTLLVAQVAETVIDRICGHETNGSEGGRTYSRLSVPALAAAIERIQYPSLRPVRSFVRPAWTPGILVGRRVT